MAEAAETPAKGGGGMAALTRKVGPLPLWVWVVAVAGIGYWLYRRSHPSTATSSSTGSTGTAPTDQTTYVPGFDAAGASGGGGIGSTGTPGTVNNYYYGDQGSVQASGGGTSPGGPNVPLVPIGYGGGGPPAGGFGPPPKEPISSGFVPASGTVRPPIGHAVAV